MKHKQPVIRFIPRFGMKPGRCAKCLRRHRLIVIVPDASFISGKPPTAAAILRAGAIPLANGMESAGIKLLSMGVDLDEEA